MVPDGYTFPVLMSVFYYFLPSLCCQLIVPTSFPTDSDPQNVSPKNQFLFLGISFHKIRSFIKTSSNNFLTHVKKNYFLTIRIFWRFKPNVIFRNIEIFMRKYFEIHAKIKNCCFPKCMLKNYCLWERFTLELIIYFSNWWIYGWLT